MSRFVPPAVRKNLRAEGLWLLSLVALQNRHQVSDVGSCQSQGFDLGQLCIRWHVRDAIAQVGKSVVNALRASSFFFIGGVPPLWSDNDATLAYTLMKMLLKRSNDPCTDNLLLADLCARIFVLASVTRLMMMMMVMQMMMVVRRRFLLLRILQGDIVLTSRWMSVLLQGRVIRILYTDLLYQRRCRSGRTTCSGAITRDAGIGAPPIRRLAIGVGNAERSCERQKLCVGVAFQRDRVHKCDRETNYQIVRARLATI